MEVEISAGIDGDEITSITISGWCNDKIQLTPNSYFRDGVAVLILRYTGGDRPAKFYLYLKGPEFTHTINTDDICDQHIFSNLDQQHPF